MPYVTEPIGEHDGASGFRSGVHALDDYFARHAFGNHRDGLGTTFVLRGSPPPPPIVGFYTLSMSSLESTLAEGVLRSRLPRYPCPVALLGRLAVHADARGNGNGARLMGDAIARVLEASHGVGCRGIIVDAKDDAVLAFYTRFGFVALPSEKWPRRMFVPMETIRAALGGE